MNDQSQHPRNPRTPRNPQTRRTQFGANRRMLIVVAMLIAVALVVVLFNIDWGGRKPDHTAGAEFNEQIGDFVINAPAGRAESEDGDSIESPRNLDVELSGGARFVDTDDDGRIAREIIVDQLDPIGEGLVRYVKPRATLFLSGDRRITLQGDEGVGRQPQGDRIESGTVEGQVIIRVFDDAADNVTPGEPTMIVLTDHAEFDNLRGEIYCRDWVDVQTRDAEFSGVGLTVLYSDTEGLQRLTVDRSTMPSRLVENGFVESAPESDPIRSAPGAGSPSLPPQTGGPQSSASEYWLRRQDRAQVNAATRRVWSDDPPKSQSGNRDGKKSGDWLKRRQRDAKDRSDQPASDQPRFYRAIFHDNVRIWRDGSPETITGDELRIVFSGKSNERSRTARVAPVRSKRITSRAANSAELIIGSVFGAFEPPNHFEEFGVTPIIPPPAEGDVYIAHDGQLVVTPLRDEAEHLATENDYALEMIGSPVTIDDPAQELIATCETLHYVSSLDRVALLKGPNYPLHVTHPELTANGERFDYYLEQARGEFIGPGDMHMTGRAAQDAEIEILDDADPPDKPITPGDDNPQSIAPKLDIRWTKGVELRFLNENDSADTGPPNAETNQTDSSGRLEEASFHGDVVVDEERFHMEADNLRIGFDTESEHDNAISELEADGSVLVKGLDERGGELLSDHLFTEFAPNADGESLPKRIHASGNASMRDSTQHIKADDLEFHLVEVIPSDAPDTAEIASQGTFDRVQVERFRAERDVFVELENGVTATGDLLEGNAIQGIADLTGEQVIVDGTPQDIDFHSEGTHAHLERIGGRAVIRMDGAGHANLLNLGKQQLEEAFSEDDTASEPANDTNDEESAPAEETDDEQAAAADGDVLRDPQTINLTWTDEFMYTEGLEEGSGTIRMRGDVHAESFAPLEENVIDAMELTVGFGEEKLDPVVDAEGNVNQESHRTLRDLIAQGNARMESRTWDDPNRAGPLRFTHIRGQYIEYNQQEMRAKVPGAGKLLINDPRPLPPDEQREENAITGRGMTLFEWTDRMEMNQAAGDRHDINMYGNVIMRHDSLQGEEHDGYMTCDQLHIALARRAEGQRQPGLDFGGSTELDRFDAKGRVMLSSQGKRIEGNEVIYLEGDQVVRIFGTDAIAASFKSDPAKPPVRSKGFIWYLETDKIQMTGLRSTIPRGG